ncbi:hypothetical protein [Mucisphaera calidilacus]|uniref:hypothetical protein n=1 Tax=Mucisphaera calidilacus TaxID=2527982 RepID=UPI0011A927B3|nr:hypothetical protein [Mucisphaera calidilacus]
MTTSKQIAKERLRQFESAKLHGVDSPLPARTPIGEVVQVTWKINGKMRGRRREQTGEAYSTLPIFMPVSSRPTSKPSHPMPKENPNP